MSEVLSVPDKIAMFLGRLPSSLSEQLPEDCRRCPVLLSVLENALYAERATKHFEKKLGRYSEVEVKLHRADREAELVKLWDERADKGRRVLETLIGTVGSDCPGSALGDLTEPNTAQRAMSKIAGRYWGYGPRERTCQNPDFAILAQTNEGVATLLEIANWHPQELPEQIQ